MIEPTSQPETKMHLFFFNSQISINDFLIIATNTLKKHKCSISDSVNCSLAGLFHKCVIKLYLEVQTEKVNVCILFLERKKKSQFIDHFLSFFVAAKQHFKNLLKRLQHFYTQETTTFELSTFSYNFLTLKNE